MQELVFVFAEFRFNYLHHIKVILNFMLTSNVLAFSPGFVI